ncbi:unnamed protein product [Calicophoron daubneyi]|uniref:Annexin n=1 Tax=Calicophoron daubneyi TaxID=300641 RepID=A0AAV2TL79_CALDB
MLPNSNIGKSVQKTTSPTGLPQPFPGISPGGIPLNFTDFSTLVYQGFPQFYGGVLLQDYQDPSKSSEKQQPENRGSSPVSPTQNCSVEKHAAVSEQDKSELSLQSKPDSLQLHSGYTPPPPAPSFSGPNYSDAIKPTLQPYPKFEPKEDARKLHDAIKECGADETVIIDVLGHRTSEQRSEVLSEFKTIYDTELIKELSPELSGNFRDIMDALCLLPEDYDAVQMYAALRNGPAAYGTLIEILSSRTNAQINKAKCAYKKYFEGRDLVRDIARETSGQIRRILFGLAQGTRDETETVNMELVQKDVEELGGDAKEWMNKNYIALNRIIFSRSVPHIRAVIDQYSKATGNDIEEVIKSQLDGDLLECFLSVTRCIRNRPRFFADQLEKSVNRLGTDHDSLIRIIVTRSEIDMGYIKEEFLKDTGKSLESWILNGTKGDYQKTLLALISG